MRNFNGYRIYFDFEKATWCCEDTRTESTGNSEFEFWVSRNPEEKVEELNSAQFTIDELANAERVYEGTEPYTIITCKQCKKKFILRQSELAWYNEKNLMLPKRCKACRIARRKATDTESK